jgi:GT2 family glycosyltransferase
MDTLNLPKVSVILVNYNGRHDTIDCLRSLIKSDYSNFNIVVVDNCSTDDSIYQIKKWIDESRVENVHIVPLPDNKGFSYGNNNGIIFSLENFNVDFFWLLNNDTLVIPSTLKVLISSFEERKRSEKVGILGAKLLYEHDRSKIQCLGGAKYNSFFGITKCLYEGIVDCSSHKTPTDKIDFVAGASMIVSTEFIQDIGLMEEMYFLYNEEIDWCLRGKSKGWSISYEPTAIVYHKVGASTGYNLQNPRKKNSLLDYYYCRNRILVTRKFFGLFHLITINMAVFASITIRLFRGEFNTIPVIFRAIVDGNTLKINQ